MASMDNLKRILALKNYQIQLLTRKSTITSSNLSFFAGENEALELAEKLGLSAEDEDKHLEAFDKILHPCLERPQSLDSSLERLSNLLIRGVESPAASRALYLLCKIRGRKVVARTLPREVFRLEEALRLIDKDCWETKYVGLVWLSMLVLVPFALESILDSQSPVRDIIAKCEIFLNESKPTREPASLCLARLLSRPDCQTELREFAYLAGDKADPIGLLLTKAEIFKRGSGGESLSEVARELLASSVISNAENVFLHPSRHSSLERKLHLKLLQRVFEASHEQDSDVVERIVGLLIGSGLSDNDSIVRWSAAKGIARVTEQLKDSEMQLQVCDSVISILESSDDGLQDEAFWHGACLALAELARKRHLRADDQIHRVLNNCVVKALEFDKRRGTRTLGSNVRDAACYVCWALVRNVHPDKVAPHAESLYANLVMTSLFDREVSCRRAAAAALQECIGRMGRARFPRGIETIQIVDYQNIGNIQRSYIEYAPAVAALKNHSSISEELVEHLFDIRLGHWDEQVRALSSRSLGRLLKGRTSASEWLEKLVEKIQSPRTSHAELHGAMLGIAEIIDNMVVVDDRQRELVHQALKACATLSFANVEDVQQSWCRLVETSSSQKLLDVNSRTELSIAKNLIQILESTSLSAISSPLGISQTLPPAKQELRAQAVRAWAALLCSAFSVEEDIPLIQQSCEKRQVAVMHGAVLAMMMRVQVEKESPLSPNDSAMRRFLPMILDAIEHILILSPIPAAGASSSSAVPKRQQSPQKWPYQERVESVHILRDIYILVDDSRTVSIPTVELKTKSLNLILQALEDYQSTNQGDVGSWVRRQACLALNDLSSQLLPREDPLIRSSILPKCAFLACEKLDHVRDAAIKATLSFMEDKGSEILAGILNDEMKQLRDDQDDDHHHRHKEMPLGLQSEFDTCRRLLRSSNASNHLSMLRSLIRGLALTAGSLSESCSLAARNVLYDWVCGGENDDDDDDGEERIQRKKQLYDALLESLSTDGRMESRVVPLLKTIAWFMLEAPRPVLPPPQDEYDSLVLKQVKAATMNTKSVSRLIAAARVLVGLGSAGCVEAWVDFGSRFLIHPFPIVRKQSAESFYLWAAGVMDPDATDFNKNGGNLEACMELIGESMSAMEDEQISNQELFTIQMQFSTLCPVPRRPST